jgi:hypothetical protein
MINKRKAFAFKSEPYLLHINNNIPVYIFIYVMEYKYFGFYFLFFPKRIDV